MATGPAARIEIVDSHTEGEPTRVVIGGWPIPDGATMAERRDHLRARMDRLRRGVVLEPRGHDAIVGALLTPPVHDGSATGVVFFNDVGYLGMCGHGTIGVVRTLQHLGRIGSGDVRLDTPVGTVSARLEPDGAVTVANVPADVHATDVELEVPGVGAIRGDIAWGGNWFFLTQYDGIPLVPARVPELLAVTTKIRDELRRRRLTGRDGAEVDHVELFGPPDAAGANSRNFVLCPGAAFDRSPCGTGTSAKLAALHARGAIGVGERWVQESITGSTFTAWLEERDGALIPHIRGRAYITGQGALLFEPGDPFRSGWRSG